MADANAATVDVHTELRAPTDGNPRHRNVAVLVAGKELALYENVAVFPSLWERVTDGARMAWYRLTSPFRAEVPLD